MKVSIFGFAAILATILSGSAFAGGRNLVNKAVSDAQSIVARDDGSFDVTCKDGRTEIATADQVRAALRFDAAGGRFVEVGTLPLAARPVLSYRRLLTDQVRGGNRGLTEARTRDLDGDGLKEVLVIDAQDREHWIGWSAGGFVEKHPWK